MEFQSSLHVFPIDATIPKIIIIFVILLYVYVYTLRSNFVIPKMCIFVHISVHLIVNVMNAWKFNEHSTILSPYSQYEIVATIFSTYETTIYMSYWAAKSVTIPPIFRYILMVGLIQWSLNAKYNFGAYGVYLYKIAIAHIEIANKKKKKSHKHSRIIERKKSRE